MDDINMFPNADKEEIEEELLDNLDKIPLIKLSEDFSED